MLRLRADSATEPVSVTTLKEHLRVSSNSENDLIKSIGQAARRYTEDFTNRALTKQSWRLTLDDFPRRNYIELNRSPLYSSTGLTVTYQRSTDAGSTTRTTFSSTNYEVDTESEPGRIVLRRNQSWPTDTLARSNGVRVDFEAGYGTGSSTVPPGMKHAIKILSGHWYENREEVVVGTVTKRIEQASRSLLWQHRVPSVP